MCQFFKFICSDFVLWLLFMSIASVEKFMQNIKNLSSKFKGESKKVQYTEMGRYVFEGNVISCSNIG